MSKPLLENDPIFPEVNLYSFTLGHPCGFQTILEASTKGCLMHLKQAAQQAGKLAYIVRELSRFTGAAERTVRDWLDGYYLPAGIKLFKVQYFLSQRGYDVAEMQHLPKHFRLLLEYIVFNKLSMERAIRKLGLTSQRALLDVFSGNVDINHESRRLTLLRAVSLCHILWMEEGDLLLEVEIGTAHRVDREYIDARRR